MTPDETLELFKTALSTLSEQRAEAEINLANSFLNGDSETSTNVMDLLSYYDCVEVWLKDAECKTNVVITKEKIKTMTPENCENYIYNGGECKPTTPGNCKGCDSFCKIA